MFATWKYDRDTSEVQNIRLAYDPISARSSQHQACDRCHEKKLKCSGEKDGCDRCVSSSARCEYNRCESKSSRKGKRSSRCSTDSSAVEGSPSRTTSQPGSPHRTVRSSRKSPQSTASNKCKSSSNLNAPSRSSAEPSDIEFSPRQSTNTSIAGSPYSLASFTVPDGANYSTLPPPASIPFDASGATPASQMQLQPAAYAEYSYPAAPGGGGWPPSYPRDDVTAADFGNTFVTTAPNLQTFQVLTPPDEYSQFNDFTSLSTVGADLWQYHR